MEPRGLPAVQVFPMMSSVYRGRNDADRVEEVVSGPRLTLRFYLYFYRSIARHRPLFTRSSHRDLTDASPSPSASRVSSGLGREPFGAHFPFSFRRLQDSGRVKVLVVPVPSWVCFFPPLPWVKVLTANQWGDEEGISTSRARARRTRLAPGLLLTARNKTEVLSLCGCVQF